MQNKSNQEQILELLSQTKRKGIDKVSEWLNGSNFFYAPASTSFHGNYRGGLAEHSLNVYQSALRLRDMAIGLNPSLEPSLTLESVTLVSLLHDICKADIYKEVEKYRKRPDGSWDKYMGYDTDYSHFPLGHGEKSVIMLLSLGLELTADEMAAIRWHMTAWDLPFQSYEAKGNINAAKEKYPLCNLLQLADGFASSLLETSRK